MQKEATEGGREGERERERETAVWPAAGETREISADLFFGKVLFYVMISHDLAHGLICVNTYEELGKLRTFEEDACFYVFLFCHNFSLVEQALKSGDDGQ